MGVVAAALASIADIRPAKGVDVFGTKIFGESSSNGMGTTSYHVTIGVAAADDGSLKDVISGVSRLMVEEPRGASDFYTLVARARADVAQIEAALYSEAYYAGDIDIRISGRQIEGLDPASLKSESGANIEVTINVTAGPRFVFGKVILAQSGHPGGGPNLIAGDLNLVSGMPAKSSLIVTASGKLVEAWRSSGFPLARIVDKDVTADHARHAVDVRIEVDPGPPAVYGWVGVSGTRTLNHDTILAQSKLQSGRTFRTADLKRARDRLVKLPSIESVRVVEGSKVDANGGLPVNLEVVERKPRYFGATASMSTTDGAEVEAHWGHRNFFGEGEHLRLEGAVSRIGSEGFTQLEFDAAAIYTKPGIFDVDTDLVSEFRISREHPDAYESLDASVKIGLSRVFGPALSGSAALAAKFSRVEDAFGENDYLLVSLPVEAVYDTRDQRLDPTEGASLVSRLSPAVDTVSGASFVKSEVQVAAYRALDSDARAVFATRIAAGSIAGASLADVPASTRFFAGGGGSVRGYEYRSLGPTVGDQVIGGLGYIGVSAELRVRVTPTFGIVPFIDAASVTDKSWPSFSGDFFMGAGLGLRYYTALGPLRIDVAAPIADRNGRPAAAVYVGLGQAF